MISFAVSMPSVVADLVLLHNNSRSVVSSNPRGSIGRVGYEDNYREEKARFDLLNRFRCKNCEWKAWGTDE